MASPKGNLVPFSFREAQHNPYFTKKSVPRLFLQRNHIFKRKALETLKEKLHSFRSSMSTQHARWGLVTKLQPRGEKQFHVLVKTSVKSREFCAFLFHLPLNNIRMLVKPLFAWLLCLLSPFLSSSLHPEHTEGLHYSSALGYRPSSTHVNGSLLPGGCFLRPAQAARPQDIIQLFVKHSWYADRFNSNIPTRNSNN